MTDFTITPTTAEDTKEFFPKAASWRIRAKTVRINGTIVGIGGYSILPDGSRVAFLEASEEVCKEYPVILYRATIKFFEELKQRGTFRLIATCDSAREAAPRWLEHWGFIKVAVKNGEDIYKWQASEQ